MGSQTPSIAQTAGKYARCILFVTTAAYVPHCLLARQPPRYKIRKPYRNVACKAVYVALTTTTGRNLWADPEVKGQLRKINLWISAQAPDVV